MGFTDGFDVLTVPYKIISSHPILADILIPSSLPTGPAPLMLHIHGGWFVTGARNTYAYIPAWVPQLALASNAIIVSGDYRLLPGATGAELNEDLEDFWTWVHMSLQSVLDEHSQGKAKVEADLTRILLNGGSAGGYCVIQLALSHPDEVKAVIAGYPMVDVDGGLSGHGNGGKPIMGVAPPSEAELDVLVAEARKPGAVVTMGGMERSRMAMGSQAWGRAREWLGEAPGIAPFKRIQEGARLPKRVYVYHGLADDGVLPEGIREFEALVKEYCEGTDARFEYYEGKPHGFDGQTTLQETWIREATDWATEGWQTRKTSL